MTQPKINILLQTFLLELQIGACFHFFFFFFALGHVLGIVFGQNGEFKELFLCIILY